VAAVTPEKHQIDFIDERFDEIDYTKDYDLVGITCVTGYAEHVYKIADEFRKHGKKVVLGGPHPSALQEEAKLHSDSVVIGEAENTWPRLLENFENKQLKPIYSQQSKVSGENIPCPRRDIIQRHKFPIARIQATRGCPHNCEFCAIGIVEGARLRKRPIENVIGEIKSLPQKFLKFSDASLTLDPEYTKNLFLEMKELKKRFTCFGNQDVLCEDDELLKLAKQAGCIAWYVGFESVSQETLNKIGKRSNNVEDYVATTKKIHEYGMVVSGSFIFGFDEDTMSTPAEILKMMDKMEIDLAELNILTPFPGTPLFNRLEKEGRIVNKVWFNYREGQPGTVPVFKPKKMTVEELQKQSDLLFNRWYLFRKSIKRMSKSIPYGFYPFMFTALGPVLFA
jgi:radical SAM superfamily enzyme YgiQ (UPF0313 family)